MKTIKHVAIVALVIFSFFSSNAVQLRINTRSGGFNLDIDTDKVTTIGDLKKLITDETNIPADKQKLLIGLKEIKDDNQLIKDLDIYQITALNLIEKK